MYISSFKTDGLEILIHAEGLDESELKTLKEYLKRNESEVKQRAKNFYNMGEDYILHISSSNPPLWMGFCRKGKPVWGTYEENIVIGRVMGRKVWESE
jgi:hypothetical protein